MEENEPRTNSKLLGNINNEHSDSEDNDTEKEKEKTRQDKHFSNPQMIKTLL